MSMCHFILGEREKSAFTKKNSKELYFLLAFSLNFLHRYAPGQMTDF